MKNGGKKSIKPYVGHQQMGKGVDSPLSSQGPISGLSPRILIAPGVGKEIQEVGIYWLQFNSSKEGKIRECDGTKLKDTATSTMRNGMISLL
jgi:hypothetical protein